MAGVPARAATLWPAPTSGPIRAALTVPGSKSLTNRALLLAAQAQEPSVIRGGLRSRDSALMIGALRALGVRVEDSGPDWRVVPSPPTGPARIDCGLAGTVMRFVPPWAAGASGEVVFDGDEAARVRPMTVILNALRELGADLDGDRLPFTLRGTGALPGGTVRIDASASSQFVSGLLLSGAGYTAGLTVVHVGKPVPSQPHIEMTVAALRSVGAQVDDSGANTWRVEPGPLRAWTEPIEPDLSNAAPFLAAAAIAGGTVSVPDWPEQTTQPGAAFLSLLVDAGVSAARSSDGVVTVTGDGTMQPLDVDLHEVGELTPTLAAVLLFAEGTSRLRGIGHLRGHETDRLAALVGNINELGGDAQETEDGLILRPRRLHGGVWPSWADHRMATAGALIGLRVPDVLVEDIGSTAKTLPGFERMWAELMGGPS